MSTSPMCANKPFEDIEATLLAATKTALDELDRWGHATRWRRRPHAGGAVFSGLSARSRRKEIRAGTDNVKAGASMH